MEKNISVSEKKIYSPESRLRHPVLLVKEMWWGLINSRELAWRLFIRDISAQYRQTALGYFWAIFPPLMASLIFVLLNSSKVINITNIKVPYPVFVFTGTVFWQLFVDALNAPLKVVSEYKAIIAKINFPRESLILSGIAQVLFSFIIKLVLLSAVYIYYGVSVKWTVCLLPLTIAGLVLLGTMIGVILIPLGILYKDIQPALMIATSGLIFLTPVAYPVKVGGFLEKIMNINPVSPLLSAARDVILSGLPNDLLPFLVICLISLILLFVGWLVYHLALPYLSERLGA